MQEIPKPLSRERKGPKNKYQFKTMPVGKENGDHILCKVKERDGLWASLRTLCSKMGKKEGKEFKCYPTETGVFYWREK